VKLVALFKETTEDCLCVTLCNWFSCKRQPLPPVQACSWWWQPSLAQLHAPLPQLTKAHHKKPLLSPTPSENTCFTWKSINLVYPESLLAVAWGNLSILETRTNQLLRVEGEWLVWMGAPASLLSAWCPQGGIRSPCTCQQMVSRKVWRLSGVDSVFSGPSGFGHL